MNVAPADFSPEDDAIETSAAEWILEREEGFAPGRAAQFAAWRAADPRHEAAFVRTERALGLIADLPAVRAPLEARLAEETKVVHPVFFRPPVWAAGLAAVLAVAAVLNVSTPVVPSIAVILVPRAIPVPLTGIPTYRPVVEPKLT